MLFRSRPASTASGAVELLRELPLLPFSATMLPSLLLGLLLPSLALARSSASSNLDKFRALAKQNNGIVSLNSALYDELTDGPRGYSVSVLLTAMAPQYNCAPCLCVARSLGDEDAADDVVGVSSGRLRRSMRWWRSSGLSSMGRRSISLRCWTSRRDSQSSRG